MGGVSPLIFPICEIEDHQNHHLLKRVPNIICTDITFFTHDFSKKVLSFFSEKIWFYKIPSKLQILNSQGSSFGIFSDRGDRCSVFEAQTFCSLIPGKDHIRSPSPSLIGHSISLHAGSGRSGERSEATLFSKTRAMPSMQLFTNTLKPAKSYSLGLPRGSVRTPTIRPGEERVQSKGCLAIQRGGWC